MAFKKIDTILKFFIYVLIAILPFSKAGVEISFVAILVLWLLKRLLQKNFRIESGILNLPLYLFVLIGIFSVAGSAYFWDSLLGFFAKFLECVLLYFIIVDTLKNKKDISIAIYLLLIATSVVCLDAMIQKFFTGYDIFRHQSMVRGGVTASFNHKNDLGAFLLFPLLIVAALLLNRIFALKIKWRLANNRSFLLILSVLFFMFSLTMVLSNSRGAWIALLFGFLYAILMLSKRLSIIIFLICACLFIMFFYIASDMISEKSLLRPSNIQSDAFGRTIVWRFTLDMIKDRPFFGHGINTYMKLVSKYSWWEPTYAHNCYLQIGAEMGLAGLLCFLWVIWRFFSRCAKLIKNSKNILLYQVSQTTHSIFLLIGLLAGMFAFLVHSFVDTNLYSLQLGMLFWYMLGITVCLYDVLKRDGRYEQNNDPL